MSNKMLQYGFNLLRLPKIILITEEDYLSATLTHDKSKVFDRSNIAGLKVQPKNFRKPALILKKNLPRAICRSIVGYDYLIHSDGLVQNSFDLLTQEWFAIISAHRDADMN